MYTVGWTQADTGGLSIDELWLAAAIFFVKDTVECEPLLRAQTEFSRKHPFPSKVRKTGRPALVKLAASATCLAARDSLWFYLIDAETPRAYVYVR